MPLTRPPTIKERFRGSGTSRPHSRGTYQSGYRLHDDLKFVAYVQYALDRYFGTANRKALACP